MERKKKIGIAVAAGIIICLIIIVAVVSSFFPEVHFEYGLDFSNGKSVMVKTVNDKLVWQKNIDCKERENILKKYHLSYKETILSFYGSDTLKYTLFYIDRQENGLKFWKWKYYFFENRPVDMVRGYSPYSSFFYIVERFQPSPAEVEKMYSDCIRIYESKDHVFRKTLVYLKERHNFYKAFHPEENGQIKKLMRRYESYPLLPEFQEDK